jgi:hypothetical protein
MAEIFNQFVTSVPGLLAVFLAVFVLNLIPIFAPPTWMALAAIVLAVPDLDPFGLALCGATAATGGRVALAKMSGWLIRGRLLRSDSVRNIDEIRTGIQQHRAASAGGMILYAFSPLPSNHLFIAYGLTSLPILFAAAPFFVGRLVSYSFWIFTAAAAGDKFDLDLGEASTGAIVYFVISQLLLAPILYLMVKIDWRLLVSERRITLRKPDKVVLR